MLPMDFASASIGLRLQLQPKKEIGSEAELPLSCDALVLTPAELEQRLSDGSRMAAELNRDLRWVL